MSSIRLEPEPVIRDPDGSWVHPEFAKPDWDESTPITVIKQWAGDRGVMLRMRFMEWDVEVEDYEEYYDMEEGDFSRWEPEHPTPDAFILSIHDTEDGPLAVFAIPLEEIADHE